MYTTEIIWLLTWPLLIFTSYLTIKLLLKKYEQKIEKVDE